MRKDRIPTCAAPGPDRRYSGGYRCDSLATCSSSIQQVKVNREPPVLPSTNWRCSLVVVLRTTAHWLRCIMARTGCPVRCIARHDQPTLSSAARADFVLVTTHGVRHASFLLVPWGRRQSLSGITAAGQFRWRAPGVALTSCLSAPTMHLSCQSGRTPIRPGSPVPSHGEKGQNGAKARGDDSLRETRACVEHCASAGVVSSKRLSFSQERHSGV